MMVVPYLRKSVPQFTHFVCLAFQHVHIGIVGTNKMFFGEIYEIFHQLHHLTHLL